MFCDCKRGEMYIKFYGKAAPVLLELVWLLLKSPQVLVFNGWWKSFHLTVDVSKCVHQDARALVAVSKVYWRDYISRCCSYTLLDQMNESCSIPESFNQ